jgi:hypothetical protein
MNEVHVARVGLFTVDSSGNRLDKCCPTTTINQMKDTRLEFLVIPDNSIPNSSGYPSLTNYLKAEASSGFSLQHLDQSLVITGLSQSAATNAVAITPSDTSDLPHATRALYVGGSGTLTVMFNGTDTIVTYPAVSAGSSLPISVRRVYAAGTSATGLVGMW